MAVTLQQVKAGVNSYVDAELGRKAQGVTKFGVYFMLPRVDKLIDKYYNQAVNNPLFADMFDESGNVDIDAVYDAAKTAMDRTGQIEMYGFRFGRNDIDAVKWKEIAKTAPSSTERDAANEVANVLFSWHSKMHDSLIKKYNAM